MTEPLVDSVSGNDEEGEEEQSNADAVFNRLEMLHLSVRIFFCDYRHGTMVLFRELDIQSFNLNSWYLYSRLQLSFSALSSFI